MSDKCQLCVFKTIASKELTKAQLEHVANNCAGVTFKKGDLLMQQGALSSNIAYLKTGLAKIHISGPHSEQIIKLIKAPAYLGIPNTFGDKINGYSVTVVEPSQVCFIDITTFRDLLAQNNKFAYEIMLGLCNYELESFRKCASRTQKQLRGNLADVLLELSKRVYESNAFSMPLSRSEIGNLIDASRESVSRIFSEFENDGIIRVSGKTFTIIDEAKLKQISENA